MPRFWWFELTSTGKAHVAQVRDRAAAHDAAANGSFPFLCSTWAPDTMDRATAIRVIESGYGQRPCLRCLRKSRRMQREMAEAK